MVYPQLFTSEDDEVFSKHKKDETVNSFVFGCFSWA